MGSFQWGFTGESQDPRAKQRNTALKRTAIKMGDICSSISQSQAVEVGPFSRLESIFFIGGTVRQLKGKTGMQVSSRVLACHTPGPGSQPQYGK